MQGVIVFLGPSLEVETAKKFLDAKYLPPARRGDITKAVNNDAKIIGLIDGVFFQSSAVAHREILYGLENGVSIVGASSMGALRAAELYPFGMIGIGKIYELYKMGKIVSDDEVALIFDPLTYKPLSEPLINIRYNIYLAEKEGIIDKKTGEVLLNLSKGLYYPKRSYEVIFKVAEGKIEEEMLKGFKNFIETKKRDLKMEDTIIALKKIRDICDSNRDL
ncbi:MAG TPA: TfuA-related McrA-glycine thioamidation protein [Halobacteria archaeon]|nr:TfuA-related McrA-glycine thioamidation protein [Halobacteria archaeon]